MLKIIRRFVIIQTLYILSWGEASFASTSVLYDFITDYMLMDDFGDKYFENRSLYWEVQSDTKKRELLKNLTKMKKSKKKNY